MTAMFKLILLAALISPIAFAQDAAPRSSSRAPVIENMQNPVDELYCVYEDKKYSEGAIKTADGRTMICMAREVFVNSQPRELYWEYGDSSRGAQHLRPAGGSKR
jgi:hypothetical protein